ncbi:hypothetical protein [Nocardia fluminea]|uniref:hypothetical protein n=1 Tax=Nocardia fluminea TaxID=134984 RepID=UPI003D0ACDD4
MLTEIAPGHWKARIYVRDTSGRRRDVTRFSPIKLNTQGRALPDRTGQRALDAVLSAAADIRVDLDDALSDSITVRELWEHYRDHLISLNRTGTTISRYEEAAKTFDTAFDTAFGGRRLFEVTTSTVEAFLQEVGHARGPSNMRTARNVLSGMFRCEVRIGCFVVGSCLACFHSVYGLCWRNPPRSGFLEGGKSH